MSRSAILSATLLLFAFSAPLRSQISTPPTVPEAVGLNIHFTDPRPGEMKMLAATGVGWVRMDLRWDETERTPGQYGFTAYDRLLAALDPFHIRAIFILCYTNPLYDRGLSPSTDEGRQAFADWVRVAVKHFRGRGILWEMYNEPNWYFWTPKPDVDNYIKLALAVGEAIEETAPGETYVGPATAAIDPPFVEACLKAGLLNFWSAVSVHPYRQADPETAAADFRALRGMIARYAPTGKRIPILAGEWGYSSVWPGMDEDKQATMLAREWLTDLANGVPLSLWYDWHDDGTQAKNPEHHFGITRNAYQKGHEPVYQPKAAYRAARTLTSLFYDDHFNKRLAVGRADDYVLLFANSSNVRLAAWTTAAASREVVVPASAGWFDVFGLTGETLAPRRATRRGLAVRLTDAPQYLVPRRPNALLQIAAAWQPVPLEVRAHAPGRVALALAVRDPLARAIRVRARRDKLWKSIPAGGEIRLTVSVDNLRRPIHPIPWRVDLDVSGEGHLAQRTDLIVSNPLRITALPATHHVLPVALANPSGEAFRGLVAASNPEGLGSHVVPAELVLKRGETGGFVRLKLRAAASRSYRVGLIVRDCQGNTLVREPARRFLRLDDFAPFAAGRAPSRYEIVTDGSSEASARESLTVDAGPEGLPDPGAAALKLIYHLAANHGALRLIPKRDADRFISGHPWSLGLWINGDGLGNAAYVRFADGTGQTFQAGGGAVDWKGWRYVTFLLDSAHCTHWGGADDAVIHYPIHWDTLFMLANAPGRDSRGMVSLSAPTLIYRAPGERE